MTRVPHAIVPTTVRTGAAVLLAALILAQPNSAPAKDIVRPEEIKSWRTVMYDQATYARLAAQWKEYNEAYPSEYAYANWMYAARYAGDPDYERLLKRGLEKYPDNPTLLTIASIREDESGKLRLLERAVALAPDHMDAWFAIVSSYMSTGDFDRVDVALRRILTSGVITDDVMDYNFNVLASLEPDAILITNGDNDTFPVWILTRLLNVRPDVAVANRSLLNTEWYPLQLVERGLPRFTDPQALKDLREPILAEWNAKKTQMQAGGLFGDTLIVRIVEAARGPGRPVYFAKTLLAFGSLDPLVEGGRDLGLVTLVTPSTVAYDRQLRDAVALWTERFRTGGLDGWRLRHSPETDSARRMVANYASSMAGLMAPLREHAPELRAGFFRWYLDHVEPALTPSARSHAAAAWCQGSDVPEIASWCKQQGLGK